MKGDGWGRGLLQQDRLGKVALLQPTSALTDGCRRNSHATLRKEHSSQREEQVQRKALGEERPGLQ